jgi:hypothetical protein
MTVIQAFAVFLMAGQTYLAFNLYNTKVTNEWFTTFYFLICTIVGIFNPLLGVCLMIGIIATSAIILTMINQLSLNVIIALLIYVVLGFFC